MWFLHLNKLNWLSISSIIYFSRRILSISNLCCSKTLGMSHDIFSRSFLIKMTYTISYLTSSFVFFNSEGMLYMVDVNILISMFLAFYFVILLLFSIRVCISPFIMFIIICNSNFIISVSFAELTFLTSTWMSACDSCSSSWICVK